MDTSIWGPGPGVQSQTPQQLHFILPNMGAKTSTAPRSSVHGGTLFEGNCSARKL